MRLNVKKNLKLAGTVLFIGAAALSVRAASYANISAGGYDCKAYGNGNINSAVFTYGGFKGGANYDAGKAHMKVWRSSDSNKVYCDQDLTHTAFSAQKTAYSADKKGVSLKVTAPGDDGKTKTQTAEISCK